MNNGDLGGNYFLDWILLVRFEDKVNRPQTVLSVWSWSFIDIRCICDLI